MTKDTEDLTQFHAVICGEYTLPKEDGSSQPRGWIQGNTKIGPVLEVTLSCLESRLNFVAKHTHSWVRICHDSNKLVTNLNINEQEISEVQFEEKT